MAPVKLSLDIKQGDTFHEEWGWTDSSGAPVPLTGCKALMQLRAWVGAAVALELSTENGRITLSDGLIVLDVPATDMQALTTVQQKQACANLGVGDPTTDFLGAYNAAKA